MSAKAPRVALVDLGMGNLRSVERALRVAWGEAPTLTVTGDPGAVRESDAVVVPGQGAFGDCSVALHRQGGGLARALIDHVAADKPYLGICLGLQVLFEGSEEAAGSGLGVFRGRVRRFREGMRDGDGALVKIPHMGWNEVAPPEGGAAWLPSKRWFYFVHSYHVVPDEPVAAARCEHGETFVAAVAQGRLLGVQFHPEKSQRAGLELLRRFYTTEVLPCV